MKIKNISCSQFAGIRNQSFSFRDGINLIYGKNESGKSTLINLISRTLFQNARLDGRTDKEFKELYFPSAKKGNGLSGDFVDGKITIDTIHGTYTLSKEWGSEAFCSLSTPDGIIRNQKSIDEILKEILVYGEGVYSDMLFSSQRNTAISLQTILDASKKTDAKQEIVNVLSQAFSESDVRSDEIEQAINQKIDEIAGKHWDIERCMPTRKIGRWSAGLGEIHKAYYDLEDAKAVLEMITSLEKEADYATNDYNVKDNDVHIASDNYDNFHKYASQLTLQSERYKTIERLDKEITKIKEILITWPQYKDMLQKATTLKTEKEQCDLFQKYEMGKSITNEINILQNNLTNKQCPTNREINEVKIAQRKITTLENKLCGMNLSANIKMFGSNTINITSLRTGKPLDIISDLTSINEAVKISIPDVMEMNLSPADVNVVEIETSIAEQKQIINDIFNRYEVDSLDNLEQLSLKIIESKTKMEMLKSRLSLVLGESNYSELESQISIITHKVHSKEEIEKDIKVLCANNDIDRFITTKETIILGYEKEYGSIESLKTKAYELETELNHVKDSLKALQDIPEEYLNIKNPEEYLTSLQNELKSKQAIREKALTEKSAAISKLENYKDNLSSDPNNDVETAERIFNERKSQLNHWLHIAQVFKEQKQNIQNNPMQDIADSFMHYLNVISNGKVSSEFPDEEKLNINIYSDKNLLDYNKLSEGTKDTVSLAFRLAVLDHLFPDGNGIIIFDDPFTDMDEERTKQSCELIKECAKRHQVLFFTCKEEYIKMLGGNEIRM